MNTFSLVSSSMDTKSNLIGAFASGLCLIHCLAAPFIFVAQATAAHHHDHHHHDIGWWSSLDYVFLGISSIAVYYSAQNTSLKWMPTALYASWAGLSFLLLNEKFHLIHLSHEMIYIPTLSLIGLHVYNTRYCNCDDEECCVPKE